MERPRLSVVGGGRDALEEQLFRMLSDPQVPTLDCLRVQVRLLRSGKEQLRLVGGLVVSRALLSSCPASDGSDQDNGS